MARRFPLITWAAWIGIIYLLFPGSVRAGAPTDEIRVAADKLLTVLKDPKLKSEARREERREKLKSTLYSKFDFTEMAKRSLGPEWQRRVPEERGEFVKVFAELLEASYSDKMESYNGEKIIFTHEQMHADSAEIGSKIVAGKGEEYAVNYRLHQVGGEWKIYDVVVENVSLVNNYRTQFHRVLAHSSFEELLDRLRKKQFQRGERITLKPRAKLQFLTIFSVLESRQGP